MSSEDVECSSKTKRLHFLLIPLMEQGHMIPMVDLARLLAAHDILVTFATTPVNLNRIRPIIDQAAASSLPIRFVELRFPVVDVGLPEGCESVDLLPSMELILPFLNALSLLRDPLEAYLRIPDKVGWPKPACLISDNLHHWTVDVARSLNIPRLIFHGPSCFFLLCDLLINRHRAELEAAVAAASDGFTMLRGLPHPIRVSKHEVITLLPSDPDKSKFMETIRVAEESADGVLVNSFIELEPWYFERYREEKSKPVWPVGPLSLYQEDLDVKAARGKASSIDNKILFQWLDRQEVGSVVLVSFGSFIRNTMAQRIELGHGLEASGRPFIWVVKEVVDKQVPGAEEWITDFEKRVEGRGMIIRGWAPQAVILGHVAVGGFVTHCGWNSTLEALATGVVMATWPHFYDQFLNERFVVEVLKSGVAFGIVEPTNLGVENGNEVEVKVKREDVKRVVENLMGGGEAGEERRRRARELGEQARTAMEEGGSSWKGLQDVINYVSEHQRKYQGANISS
ncbi:hypothetical protein IEQ34_008613 [Dendrobium chrysotoxum]|uniref:Glycosyltransferase N-terminal domain-containing protein n=1 Tax=Dendrobium chrysotoxum TaxID=161865 RepID=A0AAV7GZF1_DENCH|nr:hypothetical protein IEQ34_008613 [Dendrobium chrysotoxum]